MALSTTRNAAHSTSGAIQRSHTTSRKANVGLWIAQGGLALLFLFAGVSKLVMPAADLTADTALSAGFLRFIGIAETLGAIGLVLPWLLNIRRDLTPLAAAGLAIIMIGATITCAIELSLGAAAVPFAVGILAAIVAIGRRPA